MSYFRGEHYVFDDGTRICWWTRGSYDAHREWGQQVGDEGSAGVQVPHAQMDRFVLMRFAELLVDGSASALLDEMSAERDQPGNCGMIQLLGNRELLRRSIRELEQGVRRATADDVWGRASD